MKLIEIAYELEKQGVDVRAWYWANGGPINEEPIVPGDIAGPDVVVMAGDILLPIGAIEVEWQQDVAFGKVEKRIVVRLV